MKPSEVIAMRNRLVEELKVDFAIYNDMGDFNWIADWLIEKGWVVAPPKNEGENDEVRTQLVPDAPAHGPDAVRVLEMRSGDDCR